MMKIRKCLTLFSVRTKPCPVGLAAQNADAHLRNLSAGSYLTIDVGASKMFGVMKDFCPKYFCSHFAHKDHEDLVFV